VHRTFLLGHGGFLREQILPLGASGIFPIAYCLARSMAAFSGMMTCRRRHMNVACHCFMNIHHPPSEGGWFSIVDHY
jgi:hypothetical protein